MKNKKVKLSAVSPVMQSDFILILQFAGFFVNWFILFIVWCCAGGEILNLSKTVKCVNVGDKYRPPHLLAELHRRVIWLWNHDYWITPVHNGTTLYLHHLFSFWWKKCKNTLDLHLFGAFEGSLTWFGWRISQAATPLWLSLGPNLVSNLSRAPNQMPVITCSYNNIMQGGHSLFMKWKCHSGVVNRTSGFLTITLLRRDWVNPTSHIIYS